MADLKALKLGNPIADVIQECGITLVWDDKAGIWRGRDDPQLEIDPGKGRFRRGPDGGDVFAWLVARFGWTFGQAVRFCQNRAALPADERIHLIPSPLELDKIRPLKADWPGDWLAEETDEDLRKLALKDWRVQEALRLGLDYPGGMMQLVGRHYVSLILDAAWIPSRFVSVVGFCESENCFLCDRDLSDWQRPGQVFQAIEPDGDGVGFVPDFYCEKCLDKIRRWRRAIELLAAWAGEKERKGINFIDREHLYRRQTFQEASDGEIA